MRNLERGVSRNAVVILVGAALIIAAMLYRIALSRDVVELIRMW